MDIGLGLGLGLGLAPSASRPLAKEGVIFTRADDRDRLLNSCNVDSTPTL